MIQNIIDELLQNKSMEGKREFSKHLKSRKQLIRYVHISLLNRGCDLGPTLWNFLIQIARNFRMYKHKHEQKISKNWQREI